MDPLGKRPIEGHLSPLRKNNAGTRGMLPRHAPIEDEEVQTPRPQNPISEVKKDLLKNKNLKPFKERDENDILKIHDTAHGLLKSKENKEKTRSPNESTKNSLVSHFRNIAGSSEREKEINPDRVIRKINRNEAEDLLKYSQFDCFVLRTGSRPGSIVISSVKTKPKQVSAITHSIYWKINPNDANSKYKMDCHAIRSAIEQGVEKDLSLEDVEEIENTPLTVSQIIKYTEGLGFMHLRGGCN